MSNQDFLYSLVDFAIFTVIACCAVISGRVFKTRLSQLSPALLLFQLTSTSNVMFGLATVLYLRNHERVAEEVAKEFGRLLPGPVARKILGGNQ